jgi:alpha/beta superfamily hydrolase
MVTTTSLVSTTHHGTTAARLRPVELAGPAGRLEAVLNEGRPDAPFAALVCHPHPLGGGSMHNKVVYHAMKAINAPEWGLGWPVLRFNFRGTGLSQGEHHGSEETEDVLTALDWLKNEFALPLVLAGFSFGAAMSLAASCHCGGFGRSHSGIGDLAALVAMGLPLRSPARSYDYPFLDTCTVPKLFLSGDRDPFAPAVELQHVVHAAAQPKRLVLIPGADHFFTGRLAPMQSALSDWLKETV